MLYFTTVRRLLLLFTVTIVVGSAAALEHAFAWQSTSKPAGQMTTIDSALHLCRTGKFDAAVQAYNLIIATESHPSMAYAGLARAYLKLKKIDQASAAAIKAVELSPDLADAHVALGEVYFRQGKLAEAENEFITIAKTGAPNARAYLGVAQISEMTSLHKQAKQMIERAYSLDPDDPDIQRERLPFLGLPERISALQQYLSIQTDDLPRERAVWEQRLAVYKDEATMSEHQCRVIVKDKPMQIDLKPMTSDIMGIYGYGLTAKLNGISSKLQLDTGANGFYLNRRIAEKAGIRKVVQTNISGIGDQGPSKGYIGFADSVTIGDFEFVGCYVEVAESRQIDGADGIIGSDVFDQFLVDVDLPNAKLRLSELPLHPDNLPSSSAAAPTSDSAPPVLDRYVAPEMKSFTPVYQIGQLLIIRTKVEEAAPGLFALDTGSGLNQMSSAEAKAVTNLTRSNVQIRGLDGNLNNLQQAQRTLTLTFGHVRQRNSGMTVFDMSSLSDSCGTEISGILGVGALRHLEIKIDYRDGLVDFISVPDGKK
jgi:tetratricopeptide (TPR) repeat protein